MEYLLACIIWSVIGYIIANEVKKSTPELDINPMLYGVGSFAFGIVITMIFLAIKYFLNKKYSNK